MWPFSKNLKSALDESKKVKINGVNFRIKKIDLLNYLDGSLVLLKMYDVYQPKKKSVEYKATEGEMRKAKEHFTDVILSGVVSPKLCRKEDGEGIWIEKLFVDWDLVQSLYTEIMALTYGKKKLNSFLAKS
jgi:hypothetical protein